MKHLIKITLFFAIFLSLQTVFAQEQLSEKEQTEFRTKVIKKANETKSIVSNFLQEKHLSVFNDVNISRGRMVFLNPDKIRWEYTEPEKNVVIFNSGKLYFQENGETNTIDLNSNQLFNDFNQLIIKGIKGDMFDEDLFEISYYSYPEHYLVKFIPKEEKLKGFIETFELKFNKTTAEVLEVKMIEDTEDFTLIKFLDREVNVKVDEGEFGF